MVFNVLVVRGLQYCSSGSPRDVVLVPKYEGAGLELFTGSWRCVPRPWAETFSGEPNGWNCLVTFGKFDSTRS